MRRDAPVHDVTDQRVGHRVVMAVDLDVIVDMHAWLPPLGEHVGVYGSGFMAGRSSCSNSVRREPGSLRNGRPFSARSNVSISVFRSPRRKNA